MPTRLGPACNKTPGLCTVPPEGWEVALKLHLSGAPQGAAACSPEQLSEELKPSPDAGPGSLVQSGAAGCLAGPAGVEPAAYRLGGGRSIH